MSYSEINGDIIKLAKEGRFNTIVHGCNCFCSMGAGLAAQIKKEFPNAYKADLCTSKGINKLGRFSWSTTEVRLDIPENTDENIFLTHHVTVINAYTQFGYGRDERDRFNYDAFRDVLFSLREFAWTDSSFGFPKIGTGLAGGHWSKIKPMIQEVLQDFDVTVVMYD